MAKKSVTLWRMLVWAYAEQKVWKFLPADIRDLGDLANWLKFMVSTASSDPEAPRPPVARDAAALHALVLELPQAQAMLLLSLAIDAQRPTACTAKPQAHPFDTDRSLGKTPGQRWGWSNVNGRRIDYAIRIEETIAERKPRYEMQGRRRVRITGHDTVHVPIEFCPIRWDPDPEFVAFANSLHNDWVAAMAELMVKAQDFPFLEHVIDGSGIDEQHEVEVDEPLLHDSRAVNRCYQRTEVLVEKEPEPVGVDVDDNGVLLRYRIASTRRV